MILCIWAIDNLTIYILKRLKSFPNAGLDRRRSSSTLPNASLPRQAWNYVILPGLVIHEMEFQNNLFSYPGCQTSLYNNFSFQETSWKWWGPIWLHVCPVPKNPQHHASATARRSHHIHQKKPRTKQAGWLTLVPISWNPFDLVPYVGKLWWWSSSRLLPWKDEWCTGSSTRTYYLGFRS